MGIISNTTSEGLSSGVSVFGSVLGNIKFALFMFVLISIVAYLFIKWKLIK